MKVTLSSRFKNDSSFTSRSNSSQVKKGISLTLSKEKRNSSNFQLDQNHHHVLSPFDQGFHKNSIQTDDVQATTYQKNRQQNTQKSSNRNEALDKFDENNMRKAKGNAQNLIGVYFSTNNKKIEAKKQSQILDQHIKKLQLQIYNTRSKISQAKYYNQKHQFNLSVNSFKSSTKLNNHSPYLSIKKDQQKQNMKIGFNSCPNNDPTINNSNSLINRTSPKPCNKNSFNIMDFSQSSVQIQQKKSYLRSSSPPHPSLLRKILLDSRNSQIKTKQITPKDSALQNYKASNQLCDGKSKTSFLKKSKKATISVEKLSKNKQTQLSLNLNQKNRQKIKTINQQSESNNKTTKKNKQKPQKKRAQSAHLPSQNLDNKQNIKLIKNKRKNSSCIKNKIHQDLQFNIQKYSKISKKKKKQHQTLQNKSKKQHYNKNNKTVFNNQVLIKKTISTQKS